MAWTFWKRLQRPMSGLGLEKGVDEQVKLSATGSGGICYNKVIGAGEIMNWLYSGYCTQAVQGWLLI